MENFEYYNPTRIVFGRGSIGELPRLLDKAGKIMMLYGGGSIKRNGVYEQVTAALEGFDYTEFGGIEPNPQYRTCLKAIDQARKEGSGFLLAVGGGSVLDAVKFIAAGICYDGDPWDFTWDRGAESVKAALPLGSVLTLPATGSEMNPNAVISREETRDKCAVINPHLYPKFSILDPRTTFSLPPRQTANGIVDAFIHVIEQYLTYPVNAPLQDRQAEAVLLTLVEEAPKVMENPEDYDARANVMWAATNALNGLVGLGVPGDFATHMIGHEITALYGLDHARTLAVVLPGVMEHQRERKKEKILRYGERVWDIVGGDDDSRLDAAIERTEAFFQSLGIKTRLRDYGIGEDAPEKVVENQKKRGIKLGEHGDIGNSEIAEIVQLRY